MGNITVQNIRDEVYKLLDEYSIATASIDTNITNRIDNQINLCNYELADMEKVSALLKISQFPVANMLGETFLLDTYTVTAVNYTQASAYAYHFEVDNECSIDVKEASANGTYVTLSTLSITGISAFTRYRGFATAAVSANNIRLSFYGSNVFTIRNVAFYPYTFGNNTASIPDFKPYAEYSVPSDYYDMNRVTYRYKDDYGTFTNYRKEGDKWLIPRNYSAEFLFYYWKQVSSVVTATDTFDILDKTALIIPYAVAGAILIGNGFNLAAGQKLIDMYEYKKSRIKTTHEYGRQKLDNIMGW